MSCCGKSKEVYSIKEDKNTWRHSVTDDIFRKSNTPEIKSPVQFKYIGKTALTAYGAVTGKRYRFKANGAIVPVEHADSFSMFAVPQLKKV